MKEFEAAVGKHNYIQGAEVKVVPLKQKISPGSTARHEAKHVIAAIHNGTGVNKVTIIPGAGYNGLTELSKPDPIAALAPHATGESGTSWDVCIAGMMSNSSGAESAARSIIEANSDEVMAVAIELEEQKTLTGTGINSAIKNKNKQDVSVLIKTEEGNVRLIPRMESDNGIVMVPGEWIELSKAA